MKVERPLSQPYGCQLPFQGEPLENGKLWECRMQSAQLNAECRVQSAELRGAKLRILSDSVSSDRWSATAYLYCSSGLRNIEDAVPSKAVPERDGCLVEGKCLA